MKNQKTNIIKRVLSVFLKSLMCGCIIMFMSLLLVRPELVTHVVAWIVVIIVVCSAIFTAGYAISAIPALCDLQEAHEKYSRLKSAYSSLKNTVQPLKEENKALKEQIAEYRKALIMKQIEEMEGSDSSTDENLSEAVENE